MRSSLRISALLCATLTLTGCATPTALPCGPDESAQVSELLYFGRALPEGGEVGERDWAAFLRDSVTPRFPEGLTHWSAVGQWRDAEGNVRLENSFVLNLVHAGDASREIPIQRLMDEYRVRFRQESVLRVRSAVCVSFSAAAA